MKLDSKISFDEIITSNNLAPSLSEKDNKLIAKDCLEGYRIDQDSRHEWDKVRKEILKLARQESSEKNEPFEHSSNVKLPLLTTAALQFAARALPEFIVNGRVANCALIGADPTGELSTSAKRVSQHMSWQMLIQSQDWLNGFDKSLTVLPIEGMILRKTYYDPLIRQNCCDLCLPSHVAINQNVVSLEKAPRITHLQYMSKNDIIENIRNGYFADIMDKLENPKNFNKRTNDQVFSIYLPEEENGKFDMRDTSIPRPVIEQHRFLDLDGDGYEEPYIVLVDIGTESVLRIVRRFDGDGVFPDKNGNIAKIIPTQYFTAYEFFPSPDGSFWGVGLGQLIYPLNQTANTLINQIIDTARRNVSASGFISKLPGIPQGRFVLEPNEFKMVDSPGQDLKNAIVPIPPSQISPVLFQVLEFINEQSKQVSSITDMLQGRQEGQNMPATTALALVKQGLVLYTSIKQRIYNNLKKDLEKWYRLNALYLSDEEYVDSMNVQQNVRKEDYSLVRHNVYPVADPTLSSDAQRLAQANAIYQAVPTLSPEGGMIAKQIYFEALDVPEQRIQALLQPSQQPNPEAIKMQAEAQLLQAKAQAEMLKAQLDQANLQLASKDREIKQQLADLKGMQVIHSAEKADAKTEFDKQKTENERKLADAELYIKALGTVNTEKGVSLQTALGVIEEQEED